MNILVTGASGFVGRNLVENLKTIRNGKNRTRPKIVINKIYEYDKNSSLEDLENYCASADFVFNLAGVNRPQNVEEFYDGNLAFVNHLLNCLHSHGNTCPIMLSSSIQASLSGRFGISEYGLSKLAGEESFFHYAEKTGIPVYVYRFPNLAGKWMRPNYNSVVGTFCYNIANDLPISVNDPTVELELLFIDDLLEEMYDLLEGHPHRAEYPKDNEEIGGIVYDGLTPYPIDDGRYCYVPVTYKTTLSQIVKLLNIFHDQPQTLIIPEMPKDSFEKKLYSMYLSYLPKEKMAFDLEMRKDERGSFTELFKLINYGQISVNVSKPGITKGQHWHNTKWEFFIVVSGHGLIQERKIGEDEVLEFEVSGERIQMVYMLPGYTHNIINLSDSENLVTVMFANEIFDPAHPDTFSEQVMIEKK